MEFNVRHTFSGSTNTGGINVTIQAECYNKTFPEFVDVTASSGMNGVGTPVNFKGIFNFKQMAFTNATLNYGPAEAVAEIEKVIKAGYEDLKAEILKFYPE